MFVTYNKLQVILLQIDDLLVDVKGCEVDNGDAAERRSSSALRATEDRYD